MAERLGKKIERTQPLNVSTSVIDCQNAFPSRVILKNGRPRSGSPICYLLVNLLLIKTITKFSNVIDYHKTALQEIGARDTVTIENPPLDSPTEEEVANDVIRVDVSLKKLHDVIVSPIADLIEGKELTFLPERPLCLVSFAALQDSDSSYLSDSFRTRVLPSLTTFQLIHDCPADFLMKTGALLVGDPCFIGIIYQGRRLAQLPGARKEVEMIGRILNVSPLTGEMYSLVTTSTWISRILRG